MPNKLTDISITHISLVKAGANGKQVIYKSAANDGNYESMISIKKTDEEKGVIYGIVYAPDQVDSQGDFATKEEIEKAAYDFMKSLNANNVDVEHSFRSEAAFVAESWIVKSNDPTFPNEPEGSWAVAIKLEDESLKQLAKSGEIGGISMAGVAQRHPVEKSDGSLKKLFEAFADAVSDVWFDFGGVIKKSEKGEDMSKKVEDFGEVVKGKLKAAAKEAEAALGEHIQKVDALQKSVDDAKTQIALLKSENEALKEENKTLQESNASLENQLKEQGEQLDKLTEVTEEVKEEVQKSKQTKTTKSQTKEDETKGVM